MPRLGATLTRRTGWATPRATLASAGRVRPPPARAISAGRGSGRSVAARCQNGDELVLLTRATGKYSAWRHLFTPGQTAKHTPTRPGAPRYLFHSMRRICLNRQQKKSPAVMARLSRRPKSPEVPGRRLGHVRLETPPNRTESPNVDTGTMYFHYSGVSRVVNPLFWAPTAHSGSAARRRARSAAAGRRAQACDTPQRSDGPRAP